MSISCILTASSSSSARLRTAVARERSASTPSGPAGRIIARRGAGVRSSREDKPGASLLFRHHERPPGRRARAQHTVPIPRGNVRPARAVFVTDQLAHRQDVGAMAGAEASHRSAGGILAERHRRDAVATAAKTVGGWMQAARRRADPADDDLPPAVGEAADAAWKIEPECELALRERQLRQDAPFIVRGPAREMSGLGKSRSAMPRETWRERPPGTGG